MAQSQAQQKPRFLDSLGSIGQDYGLSQLEDYLSGLMSTQAYPSVFTEATAAANQLAPMESVMGQGWLSQANPADVLAASETPGAFSMSGIGSAGNAILPLAGAMGAYDLFANNRKGARGALQGAASGAAMGSYFGVPGALIGGGLGLGAGLVSGMGDKDRFKTEYKRSQKLRDKGVNWNLNTESPSRGRTKDELIALENAKAARGMYSNPKFAASRNEADLRPEDIWGYSGFGEKYGNKWLGEFSENQRRNIAQELLNAGAVREHRGTMDFEWGKVDPAKLAAAEGSAIPKATSKGASIDPGFHPMMKQLIGRDIKPGEVQNAITMISKPKASKPMLMPKFARRDD